MPKRLKASDSVLGAGIDIQARELYSLPLPKPPVKRFNPEVVGQFDGVSVSDQAQAEGRKVGGRLWSAGLKGARNPNDPLHVPGVRYFVPELV